MRDTGQRDNKIDRLNIDIKDLKSGDLDLRAGQRVFLTGKVYTARDAAHRRLIELIRDDKALPFDIKDSVIYYTGPTPAPPGKVIGSCGPTSSYRMDQYLKPLLELGLAGVIGKGQRSSGASRLMKEYGAVYFNAIGGAGALACKYVKWAREIAFSDLGCESIKELYIETFPVIVAELIF